MAAPQNFRTAFNGFHKEDVVRDLEYINSKHTNQINQLTAEAEELRQQFEQLGMKDVSLDIYPGDRHEILNELDRKTVYGDILKWIEKR